MPSPDVEHKPTVNRKDSDALYWEKASGTVRVATLGDEPTGSTCSIDAARARFATSLGLLAGFGTFEECADAVARGTFDIAVVPAAYPDIHQLFFDRRLQASETFLHRLPDMVAASRDETYPVTVSRVYHHPATISLVTA
ncbi:hypothetical protein M3C63_13200, partial [Brevibacterium luteolum]|uniref:hypothetical protein n=1 Tax=Brevibacterium luteolum TaxID=199591 RepID=UPI00223B38BD